LKDIGIVFTFFLVLSSTGLILNTNLQTIFSQPSNNTTITANQNTNSLNQDNISSASPEKKLPSPRLITPHSTTNPIPLSEERLALQKKLVSEVDKAPEIPRSNATISGPANSTAVNVTSFNTTKTSSYLDQNSFIKKVTASASSSKAVPLTLFTNSSLTTPDVDYVLEPTVANNGSTVFYTGNWFSARSMDGGKDWKYINPVSSFTDYCCDGVAKYDSKHKIFIWYMQGIQKDSEILSKFPQLALFMKDLDFGENHMVIGISHDAVNWQFYKFKPRDINADWSNIWADYPNLATSDNYLYVTTNLFSGEDFLRSITMRISLNDLAQGLAPSFSYYNDPKDVQQAPFTFTPVQGANKTMYWASHVSNNVIRIYEWKEGSNNVKTYDRQIPAWSTMNGESSCPGPDKINWCARADSRITGGWVSNDVVGFVWNADKGGVSTYGATFPYPYINSASFKISDNMKYEGRHYLWSNSFAWLYGATSPNKHGDIGIVASFGGGNTYYPSVAAGIYNGQNISTKSWNMMRLVNGTNGPSDGNAPFQWGDYLSISPYSDKGPNWSASGYTLQGGGEPSNVEPRYFVFGLTNQSDTSASSGITTTGGLSSTYSQNLNKVESLKHTINMPLMESLDYKKK
jgi:hypothetical protein